MSQDRPTRWHWLFGIIVVLAVAAGLAFVIGGDEDKPQGTTPSVQSQPEREFETIPLPPSAVGEDAPPVVVDEDNQQQPDEVAEALESEPGNQAPGPEPEASPDLHEDTRDETPPGVDPQKIEEGKEKTEELIEKEVAAPELPAGAQNYRCVFTPVRNFSSLSAKVGGVALHFTVSDPGSMNVIRRLFDTPAFGASSTYGWDWGSSPYCEQWVRLGKKAWAQGAANSYYWSIEIHTKDRSTESWRDNLKDGKLAGLVRDLLKRSGAPLRLVDPVGCVFPPGLTDHDRLECGNSHWDVGKNFPWPYFLRQVQRGYTPNRLTKRQQQACDVLNFHRRQAHRAGFWSKDRAARARQLKRRIPKGRCDLPAKYRL